LSIIRAFILILVCGACFVAGPIVGQLQLYQQETESKLAKIHPILRDQRFSEVEVEYSSAAQVYLFGNVDTEQDFQTLEEKIRFLFGDEEMKFMMAGVEVANESRDSGAVLHSESK